jgi:PAS domain S-box-containing protein
MVRNKHEIDAAGLILYGCLAAAFLVMLLKLHARESKYRDLIDNVSIVIYSTNVEGYIEYASAGALALTGYSPEDLIGKRYTFLVSPGFLQKVKEHYEKQFRKDIQETTLEFCTTTSSGETKWVEQVAVLLKKDGRPVGFQCFVRDITDKKQMQQDLEAYEFKLRENQLLLQSILDNTASIIFVKGLDGKYIIANRRFMEILQVNEKQLINHTDYDFCDAEQADQYRAMDEKVLQTGRSVELEEKLPTANGHIHLLLVKFPLRDNENNILGIGGIATDITERVHQQHQLIAAKTDAEDARKMQEQFLANMSHEIRTPMNGIQGMTNLLLETSLTPQQNEFVAIIGRSVDNLIVIINDILDFSRIKAGKLPIEKIDFRLQDVVDNVRSLFEHRTIKKELYFHLDIDPLIPGRIQGDPHRLNQVLINLVGNAVKFTEKGGISLKVTIQQRKAKEITLVFNVTDTGVGIPEESLPYIFESFSQAAMDISRRYGGTGLGLAICHRLLELQGGAISVASTVGQGTTFTFSLPFGCEEVVNISGQTPHLLQDVAGLLTGRQFLVVEDNPINQKLMGFVLRKAGADVAMADNGEEAIEKLKVHTYDLIIMDLQMPGMDGYETTRQLRGHLHIRTPVMAMTANAINGERLRCLEAGMNDYMSKPFDFKEFYARVMTLLRSSGTALTQDIPVEDIPDSYSLSLLEEVGDEEYLQDILNTFLTNLPEQLTELQEAGKAKDHDRLFFISHKLKGSCGMLQAATLIEKLAVIQQLAKERSDASKVVEEATALFHRLLHQLKNESLRLSGIQINHRQ